MQESYTVQVSEYAVLTRIQEEPAFAWWVSHGLRKRNRIVAKVKSKYWIRTQTFGLKVPKSITEEIAIDCENVDTLWWDVICKEMKTFVSPLKNLRVTRKIFRVGISL